MWRMNKSSPIILACDTEEISSVIQFIEQTSQYVGVYKLGLELFLAQGAQGVSEIQNQFPGVRIFLDLKLHDIPNTVSKAAKTIEELAPEFLTVHAAGGAAMISGAAAALPKTLITAVTVLTSLDEDELERMGLPPQPLNLAVALAKNAVINGARAIVCSPLEVESIRSAVGPETVLITPGVRPSNGDSTNSDDQKRIATPKAAISAGANYVVIGRPITQADNPTLAASAIFSSLQ